MTNNTILYFFLFNFNYICTISLFLCLLNSIYKIKTVSESLVYFFKNNYFFIFLLVFFNLIGIPPMPTFFLKLNIILNFIKKYNILIYFIIIFYNIAIFLFYSSILYYFNILTKSKKYFYKKNYYNLQKLSFIFIYIYLTLFLLNYFIYILL